MVLCHLGLEPGPGETYLKLQLYGGGCFSWRDQGELLDVSIQVSGRDLCVAACCSLRKGFVDEDVLILCLHHVVPLSTHAGHVTINVHWLLMFHPLQHRVDHDEAAGPTHAGADTEENKDFGLFSFHFMRKKSALSKVSLKPKGKSNKRMSWKPSQMWNRCQTFMTSKAWPGSWIVVQVVHGDAVTHLHSHQRHRYKYSTELSGSDLAAADDHNFNLFPQLSPLIHDPSSWPRLLDEALLLWASAQLMILLADHYNLVHDTTETGVWI